MKCKSLFWVFVFVLLNSTVVCAEEEVLDDTQHMSQIQEEVNENLESVEEEKNFEETEKEQELIEKPVETDKVEVHQGWFYDTQVKKWFFYDNQGKLKYGWIKDKTSWYYLDESDEKNPGAMLCNCKANIGNDTYFFDASGAMQIGWVKKAEGWYYANQSGTMQTGWEYINKRWYYLDGENKENPGIMIEKCKKEIRNKSTHNRRERPVHGHRGGSRGRFYYRITTFEGRPWDARDPYKTTFMALKHEIRLSIWRKQKETPGVEKAPGVSSPQRKESGRSGRDDGELRFWVRPGHPYKAVTSISQAEALAHGLTHLHHLVFAAVLARELDWCAALQDAREDARPWGVVGIGLRSDVWVEVRRDDHRPAVLVT